MSMSFPARLAALALVLFGQSAVARPFTIEDLLSQESFGDIAVDPSGRWLVLERRDRYDTAARYDHDLENSASLSRLQVVDLLSPGPARALLAEDPGPGVQLGPFSPSGAHLAVYRQTGDTWTLGVVTVKTGETRWFPDITPEASFFGRDVQWLSDDIFVVLHRTDRAQPWPVRIGKVSAQQLPRLWADQARGAPARIVFGSGAYAGLRQRGPQRELLRLDLAGGRRLLARGEFTDLEVSPDRRRVALFEVGDSIQPDGTGPVQGVLGISTEASHLRLVDLADGRLTTPCPTCDHLPTLLSWSPDSTALLTFARDRDRPWPEGRLLRIDAATGAGDIIGMGLRPRLNLRPEAIYAAWMGTAPVLFARPASDPKARDDWYALGKGAPERLTAGLKAPPRTLRAADARGLVVLADDALWRIDPRGKARRLSQEPVRPLREPRVSRQARLANAPPAGAWMIVGSPSSGRLAWADVAGLQTTTPRLAEGVTLIDGSRPAKAAILRRRDPIGRITIEVQREGAAPVQVDAINKAWADLDAPDVRPIRHLGPDGQALTSWLFLPRQTFGRPPPLIVRPYIGATYAEAPTNLPGERGFVVDVRPVVGHGYAVLVPSLPLAAGRTDPAEGLAERLLAIVAAAAADPSAAGRFDPERLALWGHSFGGYSVMTTITQTDQFKAAVSISGVSDFISKWETLADVYRVTPGDGAMFNWSTGNIESGQSEMHRPPWEAFERYRRNSPVFAADRIHTPLLLMHGDQDIIVVNQSEAMFAALFRQRKDAQLAIYFGEGHGIGGPGNVRDLMSRMLGFFDSHLDFAPRPDAPPPGCPASASASSAPTPPPRRE